MSSLFTLMAQRIWQALSGLITTTLVTIFLTPEFQGWYYSFLSIAALYVLFDLGLSLVLVQMSARYFVGLRWLSSGGLLGEGVERFTALLVQSLRHYFWLTLVFIALVMLGGFLFFSLGAGTNHSSISWIEPWLLLVIATGAAVLLIPFFSLIEGSGKVAEVSLVRLLQGVLGNVACWIVLASGGGLWATAMVPGVGVVVSAIWLIRRWPNLLKSSRTNATSDLNWRRDVWPLQWRVGLSLLASYLITQIYIPLLFNYQGPIIAGQMGLSLALANMLGIFSLSWVTRHVPLMAQAVVERKFDVLDRVFRRDFLFSLGFYLFAAIMLCTGRFLLKSTEYDVRVLAFWPFVGLVLVAFISHFITCLAAQLRSYHQEPLIWVVVTGAIITMPTAVWAAKNHSAEGLVLVIIGVQLLFTLPGSIVLWIKANKQFRDALHQ